MNVVYLILGLGIAVLAVGAIVVVFMSMGTENKHRQLDELRTRHIARQPWDVQGKAR